jgi:NAD(P)-dependent dehydrogenase (short-subunit alcohol dehydrogenase family)
MKKTVLITGTSSGIGKAAAQYFAKQGWQVAATMRSPEKDSEVKNFPNTKVYRLDVTDSNSIQEAIGVISKDLGKIDAVVNNAGFGVDGVFEAMTDDVIQKQFDTNVFGLMRVTRAAVAYFRTNKIKGHIIQVASMGGRLAFPLYSIYHGTKWAVEGFTESLQFEVEPYGIKLKIVEPGAIKTEFYGTSRHFVKPTDTSDYDAFVEKCDKLSMESGAKGEAPSVVAATIFKAANDNSRKLRYAVGNPAPMLLRLRKFLSDGLWFMVVRSSYKI